MFLRKGTFSKQKYSHLTRFLPHCISTLTVAQIERPALWAADHQYASAAGQVQHLPLPCPGPVGRLQESSRSELCPCPLPFSRSKLLFKILKRKKKRFLTCIYFLSSSSSVFFEKSNFIYLQ